MGKYNKPLLQCISYSEDELQLHQLGLLLLITVFALLCSLVAH